jgi:hypothetical protein
MFFLLLRAGHPIPLRFDGSTLAKGTLTELRLIDRCPPWLIDKSVDKFDSLNDFSQQVLAAG